MLLKLLIELVELKLHVIVGRFAKGELERFVEREVEFLGWWNNAQILIVLLRPDSFGFSIWQVQLWSVINCWRVTPLPRHFRPRLCEIRLIDSKLIPMGMDPLVREHCLIFIKSQTVPPHLLEHSFSHVTLIL